MDQLVQCPVCTLYLHSGMSLEAHLDTHPKDQVIRALCSISGNKSCSQYGCRSFSVCDCKSERSYSSRSRTPVIDSHISNMTTPVSHSSVCIKTKDRPSRPESVINRPRTPSECYRNMDISQNVINLPPNAKFFMPVNPDRIVSSPMVIENDAQAFNGLCNQPLNTAVEFGNKLIVVSEDSLRSANNHKYSNYDITANGLSRLNSDVELTSGSQDLFALNKQNHHHKFDESLKESEFNVALSRNNSENNLCSVRGVKPSHVSTPMGMTVLNHEAGSSESNLISPPIPGTNVSNSSMKNFVLSMISKQGTPKLLDSDHLTKLSVMQNSQMFFKECTDDKEDTFNGKIEKQHNEEQVQPIVGNRNVMSHNSFSASNATYVYTPHSFASGITSLSICSSDGNDNDSYCHSDYNNYRATPKSSTTPNSTISRPYILDLYPVTRPSVSSEVNDDESIKTADTSGRISSFSDRISISEDQFISTDMGKKGLKILSNIKLEIPLTGQNSHMEILDLASSVEVKTNKVEDIETDPNSSQILYVDPDRVNKESVHDSRSNSNISSIITESSKIDDGRASASTISLNGDLQPGSVVNTFSVIKNIGNPNMGRDLPVQKGFHSQEADIDQGIPDLICNEKTVSPCSELTNDSNGDVADPPLMERRLKLLNRIKPVARNTMYAKSNSINKTPRKIEIVCSNFSQKSIKKSPVIDNRHNSHINFNNGISSDAIPGPSKLIEKRDCYQLTRNNMNDDDIVNDHHGSQSVECRSFENISKQSCESVVEATIIDSYEDSSDMFKNNFAKMNAQSASPVSLNCAGGVNADEDGKDFIQLDTVQPVKVIAFGNLDSANGYSMAEPPSKMSHQKSGNIKKNSQVLTNLINQNYFNNSYDYYAPEERETFSAEAKDISFVDTSRSSDGCNLKERENCKTDILKASYYGMHLEYDNSNNNQSNYNGTNPPDRIVANFNMEIDIYKKAVHKSELLTDEKSNDDQEVALNIRTDERMPPRGELSGQESNGDMDAPWEGIYHSGTGSTAYDLIARETWTSDASDTEMPLIRSIAKDNDSEEMPIVVSVKPPDKNYKCATCGESFNCPKERRVHRTKEHPTTSTANVPKIKHARKINRQSKIPVPIKNEKPLDTDNLLKLAQSDLKILTSDNAHLGDSSLLNVKLDPALPDVLESIDQKPTLDSVLIKQETKRRRNYYRCQMCKQDFFTDSSFREHLKIHPLECLTCGKYFYRRANLQLHIKRHMGIKQYKCHICEKSFLTRQKMLEHLNIHTGENPIKCSHCDETFRRHSNMLQHRNRHHFNMPRKVRDFVCQCGEVYHSKKKLLWHKETHDDRPKNCHFCPEKFVHMCSLTRHIRRSHNNYFVPDDNRKKENVECAICKQVYLKNTIEMHLRTHSDNKPYSCVICNKSFKMKWNLQMHRWTHANRSSKPFKCNLCKGAFLRHTEYVSHMNSHKAVKLYTCNYCGCRFIRKYNCRRHVQEHENEKKFVCEIPDCGKTFHRSYYLADHMKVHTGARPFACNICGKTSSTKSNHNKHVKIHHAREPIATEA